jgi:polar amino acid transport system permease protein
VTEESARFWGETFVFLLRGLAVTIELTILGMCLGLVIGVFVALGKISGNRVARAIAGAYVALVRGVPTLVILVYIYYGIGSFVRVDPYLGAVSGFGLCYGGYIGEIIRAGIQSVRPGQMDAARALGFSYLGSMRYVMFPQAFRNILPALSNEGIALLKDTSLASVLAVVELTHAGNLVRARTYKSMEVLTLVAALYFVVTFVLTKVTSHLERRLRVRGRSSGH